MAASSRAGNARRGKKNVVGEWTWWEEVNSEFLSAAGGARSWSCKLCPYKRKGGADKVRAHLLHVKGHEVQFCPNVTMEKKVELEERDRQTLAKTANRPVRQAVDPVTMVFPSSTPLSAASSGGDRASAFFHSNTSSGSAPAPRQRGLRAAWDPKKKEEVDAAVARFFYHDNIPFLAAR